MLRGYVKFWLIKLCWVDKKINSLPNIIMHFCTDKVIYQKFIFKPRMSIQKKWNQSQPKNWPENLLHPNLAKIFDKIFIFLQILIPWKNNLLTWQNGRMFWNREICNLMNLQILRNIYLFWSVCVKKKYKANL